MQTTNLNPAATPATTSAHSPTDHNPVIVTPRDGQHDQAVAYLAAMESALTHARLLDDFFKCTARPRSGNKARDRYAFEYCVQSSWPGFDMLTSEEHDRIDKQLSHFTTRRAPRHGHALHAYAQQAVKALALLTHHVDPQWQPALQELLAKAKAEQKRANDPWTAQ